VDLKEQSKAQFQNGQIIYMEFAPFKINKNIGFRCEKNILSPQI
jgi:hypothetical protein